MTIRKAIIVFVMIVVGGLLAWYFAKNDGKRAGPSFAAPSTTSAADSQASGGHDSATDSRGRLAIALAPHLMWNVLPAEVTGASRGADGRVWLKVNGSAMPLTTDALKGVIRREYREENPQASVADPLLFEPGGRIWFRCPNTSKDRKPDSPLETLLGYDGKSFVECPPEMLEGKFTRHYMPPWTGTGKLGGAFYAYADGRAFFSRPGAIFNYDGKQWALREMPDMNFPFHLYPDPDGKGLVAVGQEPSDPIWHWRDGAWAQMATGFLKAPSAPGQVRPFPMHPGINFPARLSVAVRLHGVWMLGGAEGLTYIPFDEQEADLLKVATVKSLIDELADKSTRAGAQRELMARGKPAEAEIHAALQAATDGQIRAALQGIEDNLAAIPAVTTAWRFGDFTASSIDYVIGLPDGATIIGAKRVVDAAGKSAAPMPVNAGPANGADAMVRYAPAVLLQDAKGIVRVLGGSDLEAHLHPFDPPLHPGPFVLPPVLAGENGNVIWTAGDGSGHSPARLHLATAKMGERLPLAGIDSVEAIGKDGTLYVAAGPLHQQVLIYRPGGIDPRKVLNPIAEANSVGAGQFTSDGCYWFNREGKINDTERVICRFDGTRITEYPQANVAGARKYEQITLLAGTDGVLATDGTSWWLVTPRGSAAAASLEDLIAQHTAEVAKTFSGPRPVHFWPRGASVQADAARNIWLLGKSGKLKVFSKGAWIDATGAIIAGGNKRGRAVTIIPVAGGKKIFAADDGLDVPDRAHPGTTAFLMSVVDGQVRAEPVPKLNDLDFHPDPAYSPVGEPRVALINDPGAQQFPGTCDITAEGPANFLEHVYLMMVDQEGNVWTTTDSRYLDKAAINVYHDGKLISTPVFPNRVIPVRLWTQPAGTVEFESVLGLERFSLGPAAEKLPLERHQTFRFAGIEGKGDLKGISSLHFAAVQELGGTSRTAPNLFFYPWK